MTEEQRETLIAAERVLRELMVGCHFTIDLVPSGGTVMAEGCEECGGVRRTYGNGGWSVRRRGDRATDLAGGIESAIAALATAKPHAPDEDE